jgi:Ca2+:H+ antiporter
VVLIPIIGNVVEHIVAVTVAIKDKMELSMGIAVGSACQVSLFVIPSAVLLAWAMDRDLTLNFPRFEVYVYLVVVLIVSHICNSGSSNWLLGSMLITCYL